MRARETEKVFIVSGYWLTVVKVLHKKQLLAADSKDHQRRRMNWTGELRKIKKKKRIPGEAARLKRALERFL